ncbi:MAG: urea transporter [Candidatus Marinamargulisbacteria bacterium]|jgi:urea transporter
MKTKLTTFLNSYAELFFIQGMVPGLILLAVGFLNPNVAICGIISVIVAYAFAQFLGVKGDYLKSGIYTYNPLLVGLSIGYIFKLNLISGVLLVVASLLAFVLTLVISHVFSLYLQLQILSIPFVIVSSLVYLAAGRYSNLYVNSLGPTHLYSEFSFLPLWLNGFLKSVGSIIFMPDVLSGFLICVLILYSSRILFFLAITGYFVGVGVSGLMTGSIEAAMGDVNSFNFILISMAIGGIFLIPSIQSFIFAVIAVAVSTLLMNAVQVFWAQYGIPAFTLPFNVVTLAFVYVLGLLNHELRPILYKPTPEETLDHYLTTKSRGIELFGCTLSLPFDGYWSVWQGFDGKWTHQGNWKHGYDFVIVDENGETHGSDGTKLDDYFCFDKDVKSPARGRVTKVVNDIVDNPIGSVDSVNNWGNLVLIYDDRGYYVEMSHFKKASIVVKVGDWVEPGAIIGKCGNSGYSPQPHIHLQVQTTHEMGSPTMPFRFVRYLENASFKANGLPAEKSRVKNCEIDPYYEQICTFILDEVHGYDVLRGDAKVADLNLTVKMSPDGTFFLDSGAGKIYLGKVDGTFYFFHTEGKDKFLKMMYLSLSKFPLNYSPSMEWEDRIPSQVMFRGPKRLMASLVNTVSPNLLKTGSVMRFKSKTEIESIISTPFFKTQERVSVKLDPFTRIQEVKYGEFTLRRKK